MSIRTHILDPDPMIGRTIQEYKLVTKLAEGGMGAVYRAQHVVLLKFKVVKVLLPEYAKTPALRQRFLREAKAASKLDHDRILGIDNFGALDDGQLFIMVPYLSGQPLDAYLRAHGSRLAPHRALHLIAQLCDALDHAHSHGVIHRDLKPQNTFLVETISNPCAVKLLDFGIAKVLGEQSEGPQTHSGQAMGTPSYMAVEQYEHADKVTHLADVYSLAVMIWEMVTGRLPWQSADPAVLYHLQRTVVPARPPADEMPPKWTEILLAALSVDPEARPQSVRELAVTLASVLPAVGRVPSGAEILANLVPRWAKKAAPHDETVRNESEVERISPLLWSPGAAPEPPRSLPPLDVHAVPAGAEAPLTARAVSAATAEALPTTLSAATGVAIRPGERRRSPRRWKLALAGLGATVIAAVATGTLATNLSSHDASTLTPASAPKIAPSSRVEGGTAPGIVPPPRTEEAIVVETKDRKPAPPRSPAAMATGSGAPRSPNPTKPPSVTGTEPPAAVVGNPTVHPPAPMPPPTARPSRPGESPPPPSGSRFDRDAVRGD